MFPYVSFPIQRIVSVSLFLLLREAGLTQFALS
jgi:hypothetical protein